MTVPYRAKPGAGFVIIVVGVLAVGTFFAWGLRTPPLETAWRLQIEITVGRGTPLRTEEMRLFARALQGHPAIADNLLEGASSGLISANVRGLVENGLAYAVRRSAEAPRVLAVTPGGLAIDDVLRLQVRVGTRPLRAGKATRDAPFITTLPQDGPFPQLIEVRVESTKKKRQSPPVVVRLEEST